ncbi:hypothetical protein J7J84_04310 [bacterium]|nr:hypothetical protein [bacterium]
MSVALFETERRTFQDHRDKLIANALGKFVLIKGEEVVGIYDAEGDAVREGYKRFGNVPFFVKLIVEVEVPLTFTRSIF